jgi:hypothetical protein
VRDLSMIALSIEFQDLELHTLSLPELEDLHRLVHDRWTIMLDADDALSVRFEWLMPLIEAELRQRRAN